MAASFAVCKINGDADGAACWLCRAGFSCRLMACPISKLLELVPEPERRCRQLRLRSAGQAYAAGAWLLVSKPFRGVVPWPGGAASSKWPGRAGPASDAEAQLVAQGVQQAAGFLAA